MKKIFILVFSLATFFSCKAQTVTMTTNNDWYAVPNNGYYKDTNNSLNSYIGEWKYVNGNTTLLVKLRKVTHTFTLGFYQDLLIGEIQYVENGVEKINTLNQFNVDLPNQMSHNLYSRRLVSKTEIRYPQCPECLDVPLVEVNYEDPVKGVLGTMLIGINGVDTIKAHFKSNGIKYTMSDPNNIDTLIMEQVGVTIPNEAFTLLKQ